MPATDPTIDPVRFAQSCVDASELFGTNCYYLIAVAHVESGIRNIGTPGSTAFGPFQILTETWSSYMNDPDLGLTAEDRFDPYMQPGVAAKIAADGAAALMTVLPDKRLPTSQELYFVHLFGQHAATVILACNYDTSIRDALLQVYSGPNAANSADRVIAANKPLMVDATGQPLSINALLEAVGKRLDEGLTVATGLINSADPGQFSGPPAGGPPGAAEASVPWMTVAKQELANGIAEGNPRVAQYFTATTLNPVPPGHVAWCAAFVSYCIFNCGDAARHKVESAAAADWLSIGTKLPGPAYGAVAVLEPLAPHSTGHVGFVVSWTADTFKLLAGNQTPSTGGSDAVCIKDFSISKVRGWRMP